MDARCRGRRLPDFLIMPVQRLTKYPLFWKDLLKSVPQAHPDRASLEKADELVRTVSMAVNQTLSDEVSRLKTVQVLKDFGSEWMDLIAPHRKLVTEFSGSVHSGLRSWTCTGYVMTDLLIVCQLDRRGRAVPWLLAELKDVLVNASDLEEGSMAGPSSAGFGAPPPAGVPTARLLNVRLREREGMPADEEIWLARPELALRPRGSGFHTLLGPS